MKVGLYTRVSTDTQVKGESLDDQNHDGRAWAKANGHHVVATYSDPGLSGRLPAAQRPGLADALEALEMGDIDALVVRDLDRLARELTVQEAVLAQLWKTPGAAAFTFHGEVQRDDPDDPMRTAMRQMAGVFAELDRRMVVKKLRDGRRNKARKGQHANGPAPYGWTTDDGELVPVPAEQAALSAMREMQKAGATHATIATALREQGHPTKRGGAWSQPVVSRILARDGALSSEQLNYRADQLAKYATVATHRRARLSALRATIGT
jgi:DNA invertase Pin-like site-specific DNA recombinase